ncbi:MAG: serine/threonine protein kinase [Deltaproteobacteria bacterium]|nr:serine/threonine protein kinase [Deltaproteobacteria bacterium]
MGAVYLAVHTLLRTTTRAVKVLLPEYTRNELLVQRFLNEARAAAAIRHRNIITIHDLGQLSDGSWYILMDHLEGATLRALLASSGPLALHTALPVLAQVANALGAVHALGIIHRDLKPENVYLTQREGNDRHVTLLDFGVAKLSDQASGAMTATGQAIGTPAYMPPEQLRGARIDATCDVFALAVIAYQLITGGYLPFQDIGRPEPYYDLPTAEIYHRQMTTAPIDPRVHRAGVPDGWARAILAALDRDPARRTQTAKDLVLALAEATPGDGYLQDGLAIVRTVATELLDIGTVPDTLRSRKSIPPSPTAASVSRYEVGKKIGSGGMAEVFAGKVTGAEGFVREVALKYLLPAFDKGADAFIAEARLASKLAHPNIVSVLDFDRDPEGRLFLVMEFVDGKDLDTLVAAGPLSPSVVIFLAQEILRGLGYAHVNGVVHRDVSPHNVLVSWEGAVKVADFGIAKAGGEHTGTIKGKVAYLSPEQANGEPLDNRSDLFSVGIVMWQMLAGRPLFRGSAKEVVGQICFKPIPRLRDHRPDVDPDLEAVIGKLLARERTERYATAEIAIADLSRCVASPADGPSELARVLAHRYPRDAQTYNHRAHAPRNAIQLEVPAAASTLGATASQSLRRPEPRRRWIPLLAAAAAMVSLAIFTVILVVRKPEPRTSTAAHDEAPHDGVPHDAALPRSGSQRVADASAAVVPPSDSTPFDAGVGGIDAPSVDVVPDAGVPAIKRPVGVGTIVVRVAPWAVVSIDGTARGQTPVQAPVSSGMHVIRVENTRLKKHEVLKVMVEPGKQVLIERDWTER